MKKLRGESSDVYKPIASRWLEERALAASTVHQVRLIGQLGAAASKPANCLNGLPGYSRLAEVQADKHSRRHWDPAFCRSR